jgi:hypothetical protein
VDAKDRSLLAKNGKRTASNRQPLADDSSRTNLDPESDFSKSWLRSSNRPSLFLNSSPLVMDGKRAAENRESLAMKSWSLFFDRSRASLKTSRAADD